MKLHVLERAFLHLREGKEVVQEFHTHYAPLGSYQGAAGLAFYIRNPFGRCNPEFGIMKRGSRIVEAPIWYGLNVAARCGGRNI